MTEQTKPTISADMRDWNVEVVGPGKRWGRTEDWFLRLDHVLTIGFGRRWLATITSTKSPTEKYTGLGKNQHEAFARAVSRIVPVTPDATEKV